MYDSLTITILIAVGSSLACRMLILIFKEPNANQSEIWNIDKLICGHPHPPRTQNNNLQNN